MESSDHIPVLLNETIDALNISPDSVAVDATLGLGGHAQEILKKLNNKGVFIGLDLDEEALEKSRQNINSKSSIHLLSRNFSEIEKIITDLNLKKVDRVLVDLGWGSHQLHKFSFQAEAELNMCYGNDCLFAAKDIVNDWDEKNIEQIIFSYGEDRWARRIAKKIVEARPIETSKQLAQVVSGAIPRKLQPRNIHPATKTFQALRITVNDELGYLERLLEQLPRVMNENGRVAIITFHSLEDRIVKRAFLDYEKQGFGKRLNKKTIKPTLDEIEENKRSRSAKLRAFIFNF